MVPVGGSIIYSPVQNKKENFIEIINNLYPGRASGAPIIDLFITFLEMGEINLRQLIKERKQNFLYLKTQLQQTCQKYDERILETEKNNKISIACTLTNLNEKVFKPNNINATFFGSYLFHRRVSGVRVCNSSFKKENTIGESIFLNYGSHSDNYPHLPYFTTAASIG